MEYWDACDNDLHLIPGVTLIRGEAIPEGMCHLVCDVIVRHKDGTYLLMQRAPDKKFAECGRRRPVALRCRVRRRFGAQYVNCTRRRASCAMTFSRQGR